MDLSIPFCILDMKESKMLMFHVMKYGSMELSYSGQILLSEFCKCFLAMRVRCIDDAIGKEDEVQ